MVPKVTFIAELMIRKIEGDTCLNTNIQQMKNYM